MADFRKLLLALAAVTLVFTTFASAQPTPYSCNATAVPTLVRSEGIAELVGDVLLTCSGSVPAAGIQANVRVRLNATVTSNVLSGSTLDTILLLDELTPNNRRGTGAFNPTVYQGVQISATEVEFLGVILAGAGSAGAQTVRITNFRADVSGLGTAATVYATINITGSTTVPVDNNNLVVADSRQGLKISVEPGAWKNCEEPDGPFVISFKEGFASVLRPVGDANQDNTTAGGAYPNESAFNPAKSAGATTLDAGTLVGSIGSAIGQATQGTRLMARFSDVPDDVTLTVPDRLTTGASTVLQLVTGTNSSGAGGTVTSSNGSHEVTTLAVYEVVEITPAGLATIETVDLPVSVSYSIPGPLVVAAQAKGSFAPLSTVFTASSSAPEPRFVDNAEAADVFSIGPCRTILLFPFVSNQNGFDTGLAISNTSDDPLETTNQKGACTLFLYGNVDGTAVADVEVQTTDIKAGETFTHVLSTGGDHGTEGVGAPGFQGYIFAICDFQFAHGYAFISDEGADQLAQGYLALIVPDRSSGRQPVDSAMDPSENEGEGLGN